MRAIRWIAVGIGIVFLFISGIIWLMPKLPFILQGILIVATFIGIAVLAWRIPSNVRDAIKSVFSVPLIQRIFQTILLGGLLYVPLFYLYYWWLLPWVRENTGIEYRWGLLLLTIFLLPIVGAVYFLFSGIWPTTGKIVRGFRIISWAGPLFIVCSLWLQPYWFFDYKTSESLFWLCPIDSQVFRAAGYCPTHGEKLVKGTKNDVKIAQQNTFSLPEEVEKIKNKVMTMVTKEVSPRPLAGTFEVPAGEGKHRTGVPIMKGDQLYFKPISGWAVIWDGNLKRKIIIPEQGALRPCTKTGELIMFKKATTTVVAYKIYPEGKRR